jgi:hypothetical protein
VANLVTKHESLIGSVEYLWREVISPWIAGPGSDYWQSVFAAQILYSFSQPVANVADWGWVLTWRKSVLESTQVLDQGSRSNGRVLLHSSGGGRAIFLAPEEGVSACYQACSPVASLAQFYHIANFNHYAQASNVAFFVPTALNKFETSKRAKHTKALLYTRGYGVSESAACTALPVSRCWLIQQNDPVKPPPPLLDLKENAAHMRSAEGEFGGARRNKGFLRVWWYWRHVLRAYTEGWTEGWY